MVLHVGLLCSGLGLNKTEASDTVGLGVMRGLSIQARLKL